MPILHAASPVEIVAKADQSGLPADARDAALALFHALTSAEELAAMDLPSGTASAAPPGAHEGSRWPAHAFLFGTEAELAPVAAGLRGQPDTRELGAATAAGAPETLFLCGQQGGFTGLLVASTSQDRLASTLMGVAPAQ